MLVTDQRAFGRAGFVVTLASSGGSQIGNLFRSLSESDAQEIIDDAWASGVRFFDTAPSYGHGLSEHRLGHGLLHRPREEFVLQTKVGRRLLPRARGTFPTGLWADPAPFDTVYDYSYDGVMRAFEDSLHRMLVDRIDILLIHDIDSSMHGPELPVRFEEAMKGAYPALLSLRDQRVIRAIGLGVNEVDVCYTAAKRADFDCFLLAGRYTLLEQDPLDKLLPLCEERGIALVLGGLFNSGVLATGARPGARYNYGLAPPQVLERVARIEAVCREYDVPLAAAALQFPAAHPAVASLCMGASNVKQQRRNYQLLETPIPSELWVALRRAGLLREDAPSP